MPAPELFHLCVLFNVQYGYTALIYSMVYYFDRMQLHLWRMFDRGLIWQRVVCWLQNYRRRFSSSFLAWAAWRSKRVHHMGVLILHCSLCFDLMFFCLVCLLCMIEMTWIVFVDI